MPHVPHHLVVMDRGAVDDLYYGTSTLYRMDHLRAWAGPVGWWSLFVMLVVWVMLCMSCLLRRQWESERLSYPIADIRSEEHTSELQSHSFISYAVFCLKKKQMN